MADKQPALPRGRAAPPVAPCRWTPSARDMMQKMQNAAGRRRIRQAMYLEAQLQGHRDLLQVAGDAICQSNPQNREHHERRQDGPRAYSRAYRHAARDAEDHALSRPSQQKNPAPAFTGAGSSLRRDPWRDPVQRSGGPIGSGCGVPSHDLQISLSWARTLAPTSRLAPAGTRLGEQCRDTDHGRTRSNGEASEPKHSSD